MYPLSLLIIELETARRRLRSVIAPYNKFLSRRPIKDAYAVIETPETSGLIPADTSAGMGAVR